MTYMVPVHHGWLWFPERPGLVSGLIICGFGFGALIFNNVSRMIVNPENESADDEGKFSESVDAQVPAMLRTIVYCFAFMTLLAIALISPGPKELEDAPSGEEGGQVMLDETLVNEIFESTTPRMSGDNVLPDLNSNPSASGVEASPQVNMSLDSID